MILFAELDWHVVLQRAACVLALWVGLWLLRRLIIARTPRLLDRWKFIEFNERDIRVLTWLADVSLLLIGLLVTLSILHLAPWLVIGSIGSRLVSLVLLWLLVWLLARYLGVWIRAFDHRLFSIELDPREVATLERLLSIAIILVAIVITLAILGLTSLLYSALTAAGVFGIIVGFAVKDIAANFISGIFVLIDRPFVVGDAIRVKEISGTVTKVSLRSTQLVTFDGPVVTVPNSMLSTDLISNYTVSQYRRIRFVVSVLSSGDLNRTIHLVQDILDAEPRLLPDQLPAIYVDRIRDYVIDLQVVAYSSNQDLLATQSDLKKAITAAFNSHGVDLAVPIRVYVTEPTRREAGLGLWRLSGSGGQQSSPGHAERPLPD